MMSLSSPIQEINVDLRGLVAKRNSWGRDDPEIHRIKTPVAFRKLDSEGDFLVEFSTHDLVIVHGSLGCSQGQVKFVYDEDARTVKFWVDVVGYCTHMTLQLCIKPYTASFGLPKDVDITPSLNICKSSLKGGWGLPLEPKLANINIGRADLSGCELSDQDLRRLRCFTKLTDLSLSHNHITDQGLLNLSHMKRMKNLSLDYNSVTDCGLEHLRSLTKLKYLSLSGTSITFDGLKAAKEWVGQGCGEINHSLVEITVHTGIPTASELRKSNLIRQLQECDPNLMELFLDYVEDDERWGVEDARKIMVALRYHHSVSPLERVVMTKNFCLGGLKWDEDCQELERLVPELWGAAAQLHHLADIRFHCPIGQMVDVPMLRYLRSISNPENLRRLELNVGGDLIDNMVSGRGPGWELSAQVDEDIAEFVDIVARSVNLEALDLRWRLTNKEGSKKTQETLSAMISALSRFEHLTALHLECLIYVHLKNPNQFFTTSCLRLICQQLGQLQHLKLAGMQLTDEAAFVLAEELPGNTTLATVETWIPPEERDCKKNDFSVTGLLAIRTMMQKQVHITKFHFEHIDDEEYVYWSGKCDDVFVDEDIKSASSKAIDPWRWNLSMRMERKFWKRNREEDSELENMNNDKRPNWREKSSRGGGSSSSDEESSSGEGHRGEESINRETAIRNYLQAKVNSFCRLNAAGRSRILHDRDASRSEWVNLLVVVHNDVDALFCVLLENPSMVVPARTD